MSRNRLLTALCAVAAGIGTMAADIPQTYAAPLHISGIEAPASGVTEIQHRGRHYRGGHRHWRHRHDNWVPPAAFALGAIIGGAIAAAPPRYYHDRYYSRPAYRGPVYRAPAYRAPVYSGSAHTRWCHNRYRSYRAWDNTFQPYNGPRQQCWSPYN